MKNKIRQKRILSGVLGACFACMSFVGTGCFPALFGGEGNTQIADAAELEEYMGGIKLSGIKVLRRPTSYEYEENTIREGSKIKDYYQLLSKDFFEKIYQVYGVVNDNQRTYSNTAFAAIEENNKDNENIQTIANMMKSSQDKLKYFYDAIRYQITDVKGIDSNTDGTPDYYEVTADTNKGWNWIQNYEKFGYNQTDIEVLVYSDWEGASRNFNNGKLTNYFEKFDLALFKEYYFPGLFKPDIYKSTFSSANYGTDSFNKDNENINFIYTLTYAIYNIVLGLDVADAGWQGAGDDNKWIVEGYEDYEAKGYSSSSEYAMETAKEKFEKLGSYVGLTASDKEKIKNYILNEVIGESALNYGIQDLYYEDVVDAFFDYVVTLTKTGEDESTTVGDAFIASEIIDYPKTSFFACPGDDEFRFVKPCEYQSLLFMPSEEIKYLSDIWMDFKYVATNSNGEVIDDSKKSITIEVDVRWFDGTTLHTLSALGRTQTITLYNGVFDPGEANSHMEFELDSDDTGFGEEAEINIEPITCDALDAEKHNETLLETDKQIDELTSFKKIILDKKADARHYYEVVNSGTFGAYGVLKSDKLQEAGVGSYIEIAFDVKKEVGNLDKNYEFYVCFTQFETSPPVNPITLP